MFNLEYDSLWVHADIVTCDAQSRHIKNGCLAVKDGKIAYIGKLDALDNYKNKAKKIYDVKGCIITPGFIDCHTHLVYAGNRADEFELRLQGKSYAEIAKLGGGIQATVLATRQVSEEELFIESLPRALSLVKSGVTSLEIKSGYGLDWHNETKILRVAAKIAAALNIEVKKTFLGAHTLPLEYQTKPDDYVELICKEMIPQLAEEKLADAVDVFCEHIAFNLAQTERVFQAASEYKLAIKCHAEQLSSSGAALLAADYHALSVDHLEYLSADKINRLKEANTTAVLLPGAFYYLSEKQLPPIKALQAANVPIAIASDCNPGTSPITSLLLIQNMACILFGLTTEQALLGVTYNAAKALNLAHTHGSLELKKFADFAVWQVAEAAELAYYIGDKPLRHLVKKGQVILDETHK